MSAKTIMLLGTGSDVGKTMLTAALLRLLKRRGLKVAPFKAQNMSGNGFITAEGHSISRAQAIQAESAGIQPTRLMNPIMLKPVSEEGSQVILLGRSLGVMPAREYYSRKPQLKKAVVKAFHELAADYDAVVIEGAGSCSEINLRKHDLVNLGLAAAIDSPFILVADIDRGGVFAQAVGAKTLFSPAEKKLFQGVLVNKFRGDPSLFDEGRVMMAKKTGRPFLGLIPFLDNHGIEPEDSLSLQPDYRPVKPLAFDALNVAVLDAGPRGDLADLNALDAEPDLTLNFLSTPEHLADYDLLILPPWPDPLAAAEKLSLAGWLEAIRAFVEKGGRLWALGGGFGLLGESLTADGRRISGLGLIPGIVALDRRPEPAPAASLAGLGGFPNIATGGYEEWRAGGPPAFYKWPALLGAPVTGLLAEGLLRASLLAELREFKGLKKRPVAVDRSAESRDRQYDLWADHVGRHIDLAAIMKIMGL